jgi:flavodoxin
MIQRKKINQIKEYTEYVCEHCGEITNDDGWCFKCSTTPKSIPINLIDKNELLEVLEEYLKDAEEAKDNFQKSIEKLPKDNKSIFLYLYKAGEDARINLLKYILGMLE